MKMNKKIILGVVLFLLFTGIILLVPFEPLSSLLVGLGTLMMVLSDGKGMSEFGGTLILLGIFLLFL